MNARAHIPFSLLTSPVQFVVRTSIRSQPFDGPKMLPLKLSSMDFSRITVRLLLLTEYAIVQSRTGM